MSDYRYLFPFEKIPSRSRILIYGAGVLGQEYMRQLRITGYCEVVGFADRNFSSYQESPIRVFSPEDIHTLVFDYVVIALRDGFGLPAILQTLLKEGVSEDKIVAVFERAELPFRFFSEEAPTDGCFVPAYAHDNPSIALYLAGGFGDMVCQKHFVEEIIRLAKTLQIDIFTPKDAEFLKWLYIDCKNVQNILLDAGNRYRSLQKFYAVSLSVFGAKFLQVDSLDQVKLAKYRLGDMAKRIELLRKKSEEEAIGHTIPGAVAYIRRMYRGENCRTWFNYGGVFSIHDAPVGIPLLRPFYDAFFRLELGRLFVTVNTGNGSARDNAVIAKTWPSERFEQTLLLFKKQYPSIKIVQIGASGGEKLQNADVHLMGMAFGLVAVILKNAVFHLDIEGGLVHLASQLGTKCIVLFGPTPKKYYAYQQNINLEGGTCHGCYGLYSCADVCVRHLKSSPCMMAITPRIVMDAINVYMKAIRKDVLETS